MVIFYFDQSIEQRMNGTCAGGTGAFIDQMATLLGIGRDEVDYYSKKSKQIYTIASRCGVFAKSDIQPLINQGAKVEDIASSILLAVVNQTIAGLAQGRKIKGIILEGPPGNGKTLFARALAEESGVNYIATKGADFQGAVMGLGAMKVKMLFNKAKKKKPCIVFIDEFDSIGERRNYAGTGIDKENNRILTTLLNEMDGFGGTKGVLIGNFYNLFCRIKG